MALIVIPVAAVVCWYAAALGVWIGREVGWSEESDHVIGGLATLAIIALVVVAMIGAMTVYQHRTGNRER